MKLNRFATFAWGVLVYNLFVILWGAFVRATGSGAGCGSHWPLCNGVVVPRSPQIETMIELFHRATSGIAVLLVVGMVVWAFRVFPKGHIVRAGVIASFVIIMLEALVGGVQVMLGLTGDNVSVGRAFIMIIHLVNTFLLIGALVLTAWWASGGAPPQLHGQGFVGLLLGIGMLGMLLVGASGAIAALGNTLFPSATFADNFSSASNFLIQLRVYHPIIAVAVGAYLVVAGRIVNTMRPGLTTRRMSLALLVLFGIQLALGGMAVVFRAPTWMQLTHLFLADLVWMALVLMSASALAKPVEYRIEQPARVEIRPA